MVFIINLKIKDLIINILKLFILTGFKKFLCLTE